MDYLQCGHPFHSFCIDALCTSKGETLKNIKCAVCKSTGHDLDAKEADLKNGGPRAVYGKHTEIIDDDDDEPPSPGYDPTAASSSGPARVTVEEVAEAADDADDEEEEEEDEEEPDADEAPWPRRSPRAS